jgi:hypothetical protein
MQYSLAVHKGTEIALRRFIQKFPGHIKEEEAKHALSEVIENNEFNKATKAKSIAKLSRFVKCYPKISDSEKAIDEILNILKTEYPDSLYNCSVTSENLKSGFPEALLAYQPWVVAFTP